MKRYLVFVLTAGVLVACSSTSNIKIVSPSTPENEAKEEISKAPVTKLETVSPPEVATDQKTPRREPADKDGKTGAGAGADHTVERTPSLVTGHSMEALISLLEKKGIITKEELLREMRELEKKEK